MVCFLHKYFFYGSQEKNIRFQQFITAHNSSHPLLKKIKDALYLCYVNCCESQLRLYILLTTSRIEAENLLFMGGNCLQELLLCQDSLCHSRLLLLSSITGFVISEVSQTNVANQNLHESIFGSLPCRITLQTRCVVF